MSAGRERHHCRISSLSPWMDDASIMEKSVRGAYYGSGDPRLQLPYLLDLYKNGRLKLDELMSKRYSFEQITEGFDDLQSGKNARGICTSRALEQTVYVDFPCLNVNGKPGAD